MKVFTHIDHAAAAKEFGLTMPPSTVVSIRKSQKWHTQLSEKANAGDRLATENPCLAGRRGEKLSSPITVAATFWVHCSNATA